MLMPAHIQLNLFNYITHSILIEFICFQSFQRIKINEDDIDIVGEDKKEICEEERERVVASLYGPPQYTEADVLQANTKEEEVEEEAVGEEGVGEANGEDQEAEESQRQWCSHCQVGNN